MHIMIIGGGGREHAIVRALRKNPRVDRIFCLPGNGGMWEATPVPIGVMDIEAQLAFAQKEKVEYVIVSPDDPLIAGAADRFRAAGFRVFGPSKAAAKLEGSKLFAKKFMTKHHIPTAVYATFTDAEQAHSYIAGKAVAKRFPLVIKADGPALGKGVTIAQNEEEAHDAIKRMMEDKAFGESGNTVLIERCLEGPEVSVLVLTDGKTFVPLVSSMDHKRALDGDRGPNTGGMGVVAPNPFYTEEIALRCEETIFRPTIQGMAEDGTPFTGCLYFGLMLTEEGPMVIEYNCRFGDPEAQTVLALLESDLLTAMEAVTDGTLSPDLIQNKKQAACCVILASRGYPGSYYKNVEMQIPEEIREKAYAAGVREEDGHFYTNGGRVIGVVETAPTLETAMQKAYGTAEKITFENRMMRSDIGARALAQEKQMAQKGEDQ